MSIEDEAGQLREQLEKEMQTTVSVALFGQPGAGKSSLINKMIGEKVAQVGVETDKTTEAESHSHTAKGVTFVDLPGYGTSAFPKEGFFERFDIQRRDLFLCVTSGKLHQSDTEFFQDLTKAGKVCIFVSNKCDELWEEDVPVDQLRQRWCEDIAKHVGRPVPVIFTSCRTGDGLDELQRAITQNLDGAKRERWVRGAKAYSQAFLDQKKEACKRKVLLASGLAAANGVNPIPGADVAVDVTVLVSLFKEIRDSYGLSDSALRSLTETAVPYVAQLANRAAQYAAKEGVLLLLRNFVGREAVKTVSKYIPVVGQAIAASIGFAITYQAGNSYLDDCHALASEVLQRKLKV